MTQQYSVGIVNLEIPASPSSKDGKPSTFGSARLVKNQQPALQLDTVLLTLYYPSVKTPVAPLQRTPWLQRPLMRTIRGYAAFSQRSPYLMAPILVGLFGTRTLKGYNNQALIEAEKAAQAMPVVIFSHGLGGTKTTYSEYCTNLASNGYVVAAVESRDGSGPISIVNVVELGDKTGAKSKTTEKIIDYLRIEDLEFPPDQKLTLNEFRGDQLALRVAEIEQALSVLSRINNGDGDGVEADNLLKDTLPTHLSQWKGRLDEQTMTMSGHSFGGATLMQVLRSSPQRFPFVRGIALDPWVDPIAALDPPSPRPSRASTTSSSSTTLNEDFAIGTEINVPLLVINSEPFTLWTPHFNKVRDIVRGVSRTEEGRVNESWLVTLVGSIHLSFSDFPLALPARLVQFFVKSNRIKPQLAMDLSVALSLEFLSGATEATKKVLVGPVLPGDEEGRRAGEGYKREGLKEMEKVGDVRLHFRP